MTGWYLTQRFAPDTPGTQVFLAPGPEEVPLAPRLSPWIRGRMVRVPGRYWHRILLALQHQAPEIATILDSWSGSPDPEDDGQYLPTADVLASLIGPVRYIITLLHQGDLVTDEELKQLGPYTRQDMAAMLDAVVLVIQTAIAHDVPFAAWPE